MSGPATPHVPVLLDEVLVALAPRPGDVIVDATFGAGGYTRALLDAGATVHAFDRDPDAIAAGRTWPETSEEPPRLVLHPRRFSEMVEALGEAGVGEDAIEARLDEVEAARRPLEWARDGDLVVLPVHELGARAKVVALLDTLRAAGWRPGMPLPQDQEPSQ